MFPLVETVTLAPSGEIKRRLAPSKAASTNQNMHQNLFEPLVIWAGQRNRTNDAGEVILAITRALLDYRKTLSSAGARSFDMLLEILIPEIVHAMLDDPEERKTVLFGLYATFMTATPPLTPPAA